jgi:hydrogenase maturation factor
VRLAIPRKILEISLKSRRAPFVDLLGVRRSTEVSDEPRPRDWVLIHAGFALSEISEQNNSGPQKDSFGAWRGQSDSGRGVGVRLGEDRDEGNQKAGA